MVRVSPNKAEKTGRRYTLYLSLSAGNGNNTAYKPRFMYKGFFQKIAETQNKIQDSLFFWIIFDKILFPVNKKHDFYNLKPVPGS